MRLIFLISWRNLWRHRGKSLVIGVILFIGAFLMTVGNGVITGMDIGISKNVVNTFMGDLVLTEDEINPVMLKLEQSGIEMIRKNRDVVFAVCWHDPDEDGHSPSEISRFAEQLRKSSPGLEFWCLFVRNQAEPWRSYAIPREVDAIIMRALAPKIEDRYQSASEIIRDLSLYKGKTPKTSEIDDIMLRIKAREQKDAGRAEYHLWLARACGARAWPATTRCSSRSCTRSPSSG